jgi:hypothetical protein
LILSALLYDGGEAVVIKEERESRYTTPCTIPMHLRKTTHEGRCAEVREGTRVP